jgi:uncharacterized peroxidase-related enzyme
MNWIRTIQYGESEGRLRALYDRVRGPNDYVDNILKLHSLRPHTLETVGVYVSRLNGCEYCVEHHFAGLQRLLGDEDRAAAIRTALESGEFEGVFNARETEVLRYARCLTEGPERIDRADVDRLREVGLDDGEILEVNQVVSYFAYANRTVQGLGGTTEGDILGLSPGDSEDPDNWQHG